MIYLQKIHSVLISKKEKIKINNNDEQDNNYDDDMEVLVAVTSFSYCEIFLKGERMYKFKKKNPFSHYGCFILNFSKLFNGIEKKIHLKICIS